MSMVMSAMFSRRPRLMRVVMMRERVMGSASRWDACRWGTQLKKR